VGGGIGEAADKYSVSGEPGRLGQTVRPVMNPGARPGGVLRRFGGSRCDAAPAAHPSSRSDAAVVEVLMERV